MQLREKLENAITYLKEFDATTEELEQVQKELSQAQARLDATTIAPPTEIVDDQPGQGGVDQGPRCGHQNEAG